MLAAAGGFLGDLLKVAGWAIVALTAIGAIIGAALYVAYRKLKQRVS